MLPRTLASQFLRETDSVTTNKNIKSGKKSVSLRTSQPPIKLSHEHTRFGSKVSFSAETKGWNPEAVPILSANRYTNSSITGEDALMQGQKSKKPGSGGCC